MIVRPDGSPVVLDFGLARDLHAGRLTRTGEVLGTPAYMAPEQVTGGPQDARVDVYGLGAILYECLTGRPPFDGPTPIATLSKVALEDPRWPTALGLEVPFDLEALLRAALAKDPAARPASAAALRDQLDDWLRRDPGDRSAPPPSRLVPALGGAAVLALLLLAAALLVRRTPPQVVVKGPGKAAPTAGTTRPGTRPPTLPPAPPPPTPPPPAALRWEDRVKARKEAERPMFGFNTVEDKNWLEALNKASLERGPPAALQPADRAELARLARAGYSLAQKLAAEHAPPRERVELLWSASRSPLADDFAGVRLVQALLRGPSEVQDRAGAEWLLAETAWRASHEEDQNLQLAVEIACACAWRGERSDLGRALRLFRDLAGLRSKNGNDLGQWLLEGNAGDPCAGGLLALAVELGLLTDPEGLTPAARRAACRVDASSRDLLELRADAALLEVKSPADAWCEGNLGR